MLCPYNQKGGQYFLMGGGDIFREIVHGENIFSEEAGHVMYSICKAR